jgi:MFS transporter, DHA1 family, inner membrane transport protein
MNARDLRVFEEWARHAMTKVNGNILITTLSAANFAIGMGAFVVVGVLTPIGQDLTMTPGEVGFVLTAYAIAYAILSPLLVALTGSWSRRTVLLLGMSLFGLGAALSALSETATMLYISRIVAAAGGGMFTPVAASVAFSVSAPEDRNKALSKVFFGLTLAQAIGVPAGAYIAYTFGWQAAFIVVAVLALVSIALCFYLMPKDVAFQVNTLQTLRDALLDWRSMLSVFFTTTYLAAIYIVFTYLALLIEERQDFARDGVSLFLLIRGIGAVNGNWFGGQLSDRFGPDKTLVILCVGHILMLPLFSLLPLPVIVLAVLCYVWSAFGWAFMTAQQNRLITQTPERQSVVLSLNAAAVYIGASLGSYAGGHVLQALGMDMLGIIAALAMVFALGHLLVSQTVART